VLDTKCKLLDDTENLAKKKGFDVSQIQCPFSKLSETVCLDGCPYYDSVAPKAVPTVRVVYLPTERSAIFRRQ